MEVQKVAKHYGCKILPEDVRYCLAHCKYESTLPGNAGCFTKKEIFGSSDRLQSHEDCLRAPHIWYYRALKLILGQLLMWHR